MAAPTWLAATSGCNANAGQINQFLAAHAVTYVWTGVQQANQETLGSGSVNSDGLWIAQSFATTSAQTTAGYVMIAASVTGSPAPWTVSLQASNSGAPSGIPLVSVTFPKELADASFTYRAVMLPVTGLTPSATYWIVANAAGDGSDYFAWNKSNQTSGASTSSNGTSWTTQTYGLLYQVWDGSAAGALAGTWEDSGARWTSMSYSSGSLTEISEWTAGQTANGYCVSERALSYSGPVLTGVA